MQSFFLKNTINIQVSAQFQGLMNSSKPTEFQINDTGGCKTFWPKWKDDKQKLALTNTFEFQTKSIRLSL